MNGDSPVAIVTGAASGIGQAIAMRLAADGFRLTLIDVAGEALTTTAASLPVPVLPARVDVADRAAMFDVVRETTVTFARVDVLVNAAGILRRAPCLEHTLEDWRRTLAVNLDGPFWLCQAVTRQLLAAGSSGAIVNIVSVEAVRPLPYHVAYSVSKGALLMLTKAMALELAPYNIRVNAIGPGVIETGMNVDARQTPAASAALKARIPMRRFGRPAEVAEVAAFLISERASYITGALILVDGGWTAS